MAKTPTIEELRAQKVELDKQIASISLPSIEAYAALLASPEVDQLMTALVAAAEPLDDATRKRTADLAKMRDAMARIATAEQARMRKLVDADQATS